MRIITYNVNGIRAALRKGLAEWLAFVKADIVCFQEIKAHKEDIDISLLEELGYHSYWFSAEKRGYSGVGILSKEKPLHITKGNGYLQSDKEGRVLLLEYDTFRVVNAYFPSGSSGDVRQTYKYQWLREFDTYIKGLQNESDKLLLICGDYNICHRAIDIHDPVRNANSSGFLPEERAWMENFLQQRKLTDSFRHFYPEQRHAYTWWSFRAGARANNKGWRIDYICLSSAFVNKAKGVKIIADAKHSDHCPVLLELR